MSLEGSLKLQLDITRKLILSMDKVLTSIEKSNSISSSQTSIINEMSESFEKLNNGIDDSAKKLEDTTKSLDKVVKGQAAQSSQNKYMNALSEFRKFEKDGRARRYFVDKPMKDLKKKIFNFGDTLLSNIKNSRLAVKISTKFKSVRASFEDFNKAIKQSQGFLETTLVILKGVKEVLDTVIGGIATFGAGFIFKIVTSLISGVFNVLKSATGMIIKFLKLTLSLPFQIAQAAASLGGKIRKEIVETFYQAREDAKRDFDLNSSIGEGVRKLTSITIGSLKQFEFANSNLTRLFGYGSQGAAQMFKFTVENVAAMGHFSEIFGKSIMQSEESIEFLARAQKSMNMSTEDIGYMALVAASNGESIYSAIDNVRESIQTISTSSGVDFKRLSTNFLKLRKDIVEFGHLTNIELAQTTSRIIQLGVKTEDVSNVFKQFGTFESAATSAAQLYQTFGMNIDAFTLISERDPAKIIDMFRQGMYETGRTFDDLNRHEKSLMSQFTGLSGESLKAAMNFRNMNFSYKELKEKMKAEDATEKQIKTIDSLSSSITEFQKTLQFKSPFEAFFKGLVQNSAYNEEMYGELMELSSINESIYNFVLNTNKKTLRRLMSPILDVIRVMKSVFSDKGFKKTLKGGLKSISDVTLAITKSVFSPDYLKEVDKLVYSFEALSTDRFKKSNSTIYRQIKLALSDKQKSKHLKRAFRAAKINTKKLSKMSTEKLLKAIKDASYAASNDVKQQTAIRDLTKSIFNISNVEFDEEVRKKVIKKTDPLQAIDNFVDEMKELLNENKELGKRVIEISGTLMGNIIRGAGTAGLSSLIAIKESLGNVKEKSDDQLREKLKDSLGFGKGFDWKTLSDLYAIEIDKIIKNEKAIKTIIGFVKNTFKPIVKGVTKVIQDIFESIFEDLITSDNNVIRELAQIAIFGSETIGEGTAQAYFSIVKKYGNDAENTVKRIGKSLTGTDPLDSIAMLETIKKINENDSITNVFLNSGLIQMINEIWTSSKKHLDKKVDTRLYNKLSIPYNYFKGNTNKAIQFLNPKVLSSYAIDYKKLIDTILAKKGKNITESNLNKNEISIMKDLFYGQSPGFISKGDYKKEISNESYNKFFLDYKNVDDSKFNKNNSSNIKIISNSTLYLPVKEDKGEFIVWKRGGVIYNMFSSMNNSLDRELQEAKVISRKISISKKQKRASGKQIKEIIRKVIEYKEKIKNREVKVNNTIKSDNEELSNVIVSN